MFFSSCATLMNESTTRIRVRSDTPSQVIVNNKSYQLDKKLNIKVERSKDSLLLKAKSDSLSKVFVLKSKNSFYYYANILTYGIGFIWDSKNINRYTYQRNVFINYNSDITIPDSFKPCKKGQLNLIFSLPHINSFYLHPIDESTKINNGFWGLSVGIDYFYNNHKFMRLTANAVTDFFVPFPAAVDIIGEYELMSSFYFSLTDNYKFKTFTFGYGLNYSKNTWDFRIYSWEDSIPPLREPIKKSSQSIGVTLNGYYQLGNNFSIGLIYRPTFLQIRPFTEFKYEHLISVDFSWKWKTINK